MDYIGLYEQMFVTYGWTYWDIMCLPIPVFVTTLEALRLRLEREEKAQKDALKKSKNKHNIKK